MPLKICPKCNTSCGPRTLTCKGCGHDFKAKVSSPKPKKTKRRFRQLCGIGAWINDPPKDMPQVTEPEPLSELPAKLDIPDISHLIAYEGLGFCVIDYISPDKIADPELAAMWADAKNRLTEIIDYVARGEIAAITNTEED